MLDNLKKYKVILASNSPRRKELLSGLGLEYEVKVMPGIDETYPETLSTEEVPVYIACEKAEAYRKSIAEDELIITADTVVCIDGEVLGKPADAVEAHDMLRKLAGRTHLVITGVCLTTSQFQKSFASVTEVTFDKLTDDEISFYVDKYRPFDKAGAYGVQEWIGYVGVTGMNGSFYNVMGLPVQRLYQELKKL